MFHYHQKNACMYVHIVTQKNYGTLSSFYEKIWLCILNVCIHVYLIKAVHKMPVWIKFVTDELIH